MKLEVTENGLIRLKEVFNPIVLTSEEGEVLSICMRDSGFEISYAGGIFSCKKGIVE